MGALIYQWIDLLWLPLTWFIVPKKFRYYALAFTLVSMMTMRLVAEIYYAIDFPLGFTPFMQAPPQTKGLILYSIIYTLYLTLAHYSPGTREIVFFAASLTIYFMTTILCVIIMAI